MLNTVKVARQGGVPAASFCHFDKYVRPFLTTINGDRTIVQRSMELRTCRIGDTSRLSHVSRFVPLSPECLRDSSNSNRKKIIENLFTRFPLLRAYRIIRLYRIASLLVQKW